MLRLCFLFVLLMTGREIHALDKLTFRSPNNKIAVSLVPNDSMYYYLATYGQDTVFKPSSLGLVLGGNDSLIRFTIIGIDSSVVLSEWEPRYGTSSRITENYRLLCFHLHSLPQQRKIDIEFRVYDDGFAFRYLLPDSAQQIEVVQELTSFNFFRNGTCWWSWADYNTYEKLYQRTALSEAPHVATPFTVQFDSGLCVSIHEASIDQYTSMTLRKSANDSLSFNVNLVPWSDGVAVKTASPMVTPWRVVFIAPHPAQLISSNLLLNLNSPPSGDFAFVKPIRYIGIWWDMHLGLTTWKHEGGRHGATTEKTKAYIDFAAAHGIEGVLVEGWNTGWERWGEKNAFDFTTPYPDFDLEEIARYANTRNVQLIGHHETGGDIIAYESRMDSAFALYKRLGIHYIKTGYAGPVNPSSEHHHGQYMINHFNRVMRLAADYELMLDVHEPIIPSGLSRSYPNLMTFEAVRGMEWNAWSEGNPPSHTCTLPFTRGMAGPMDYTPGIFDINEDNFAAQRVAWNGLDKGNNAVHSTLSNQIALMIVNYSPMQMAADLVENYNSHPAFHVLQQLPSTWDESRVIAAAIGEYVVVARRRGTTWYIAGITNEYSREISVPLDFLDDAIEYSLVACLDAPSSNYTTAPESYALQSGKVKSTTPFTFWMAPGGGGVIILRR